MATIGPANLVTSLRAVLSCGVAALVALSLRRARSPSAALVVLSTVALALDWVDGQVARRTHTESAFGARFDMEVDAFLILVLSVYVASSIGVWVLAIGLARYLLLARRAGAALAAPADATALLGQGGRRDSRASCSRSPRPTSSPASSPGLSSSSHSRCSRSPSAARSGGSGALATAREVVDTRFDAPLTVLAVLLVWVGLTLPDRAEDLGTSAFVRLPLEALVLVALAVLLPTRARNITAVAVGVCWRSW